PPRKDGRDAHPTTNRKSGFYLILIPKLEAYKRLQIPEVWFWENSRMSLYALKQQGYEEIASSQLLPELDMGLLVRCVNMPSHVEAIKEFKSAIAADV
ncbi:hypothetical protein QUB35_38155, partial [Microcoleus sp. B13-B6]